MQVSPQLYISSLKISFFVQNMHASSCFNVTYSSLQICFGIKKGIEKSIRDTLPTPVGEVHVVLQPNKTQNQKRLTKTY
jgi:hypothetical protein